jgi:hypothetical protein
LGPTCLCENTLWELVVPSVFYHCDLAGAVGVDLHYTFNDLLLSDALDFIAGFEIHGDWVARRGDILVKALNFGEGLL